MVSTRGLPWSDGSVSWLDQDLVRPVGAGECELRLNVPRQCWAGGFICSDRLLTVCDDERQLRVGAQHRLFSWQCELWGPEGARVCISRPPLLLIPPSEVHCKDPRHTSLWFGCTSKMIGAMGPSAPMTVSASWITLASIHNSSKDSPYIQH